MRFEEVQPQPKTEEPPQKQVNISNSSQQPNQEDRGEERAQ